VQIIKNDDLKLAIFLQNQLVFEISIKFHEIKFVTNIWETKKLILC